MTLRISPSAVKGRVAAAPSKSYTHRAFLMGLLANGTTRVDHALLSADPLSTLGAVRSLGATVETGDDIAITSTGNVETPTDIIDCGNSGTTLRLVTAIAALAPHATVLTGDASLRTRPMRPLLAALEGLGVSATSTRDNGCAPIVVRGPMRGGRTRLPGDVSSQFVSALIMAGARTADGIDIQLDSELKSRPYVDITLEMLDDFGGRVDERPDGFHVPGNQALGATRYAVPGDYSTAAFPLAAGALAGEVTVDHLPERTAQGDKAIVDMLQTFGARVTRNATSATVREAPLTGAHFDLSDTPDLFPILCAIAAHAKGETVLSGAAHLRFKESDRIAAMVTNLQRMGVDAQEREDGARIRGGPVGAADGLVTHGDHRILMALAVCGLRAQGPLTLDDHEAHRVSYPGFIEDFTAMGARMEVMT